MVDKKLELHEFEAGFIHRTLDPAEVEALGEKIQVCRVYNHGAFLDDRLIIEEKYEKNITDFYISNPLYGRSFIDDCVPKIEDDLLGAVMLCIPDLTDDERITVSEIALQISKNLYAKFEGMGAFGVFIESVIEALNIEKFQKHKLSGEIDRLHSILKYWYMHETNWRELHSMPTEFGIGYITGLLSPALDLRPEWWALKDVYERVGGQITTNQQAKRGGQKGSTWTTGMEGWLSKKIADLPTKTTKSGVALKPSNRSFAIAIKDEAINYNQNEFGYKWSNDQAAFEWIQKTLRKLLNSSR